MKTENLRDIAQDYYAYKHACSILFKGGEYWVNRYLKYHETYFPDILYPTKETVQSYEDSFNGRASKDCIGFLKEFCCYLRIRGYDAYITKSKGYRAETQAPYIITHEEGDKFFDTLDCMAYSRDWTWRGKEIVLPAFYRMMWCCGTRTKETCVLLCENVHLDQQYVDIMNSKGLKDRRIFLSKELTEYYKKYDEALQKIRPERNYFFPGKMDKEAVSECTIENNFKKIWYTAFPDFDRDIRIRVYDFRHHFVYENINRWLKDGKDINVMIYYLMQVTGHKKLDDLLYYFHLVPEIYKTIKSFAKDLDVVYPDEYSLPED